MGICAVQLEGDNYRSKLKNKNTVTVSETEQNLFSKNRHIGTTTLGQYATITTILGHYSQHFGQALLCLTTLNCMNFCEELREYSTDSKAAIQKLKSERSIKNYIKTKKGCPYEKVCVCVIPDYTFKECQETQAYQYRKNFRVLVRNIFKELINVTIYITQTSAQGIVFPTQTILALLFMELCTGLDREIRINIISPEPKILQMVRYELLKTEACPKSITEWDFRNLPGPFTLNQT